MKMLYSVCPSFVSCVSFALKRSVPPCLLVLAAAILTQSNAATVTWTNTANGIWNAATNWSPNQIPGVADSAILANGRTITVGSPVSVSNFTFSSGALIGAGPLSVLGTMNWSGGDLSGALVISNAGTLTISNGVSLNSTAAGGALTNYGTVIWAAAAANYLSGYGNAVILNAGIWQATANNTINNANSGTNSFINTGTFQKLGATGTTTINWRFNTIGTINTTAGNISCSTWTGVNTLNGSASLSVSPLNAPLTISSNSSLDLVSGSDISSALTIAAGATLTISNGISLNNNSPAGGAVTNYGTVIWAANAANYITGYGNAVILNAGLWQVTGNDAINNGNSGTNDFINTGTFQKIAGTSATTINWRFNTTGTITTTTGSLSCSSWTGNSTLNGNIRLTASPLNAPLTVSSNSSLDLLSSCDISSALTIAAGATLTISNSISLNNYSSNGALTNYGTVIWAANAAAYLTGFGNAIIYNAGQWQVTGNDVIQNGNSGTNTFINVGTLQKIAGAGTSSINWNYVGTGSIGTASGSFDIDQWVGNSTVSGTANLTLGTVNGSINLLPGTVANVSAGTIYGSITVSSNAVMNWANSSADILDSGWLTVAPGGTLTISNILYFGNGGTGGALTNYGTVIWGAVAPSYIYGYGGGVIYNAGSWQATATDSMLNQIGTNIFYNSGTFQKTGGSGTSSIDWYFNTTGFCSALTGTLYIDQWIGNSTLSGVANLSIGTVTGSINVLPSALANISGGTIYGSITVSSNATMNWANSSADILATGWLTVASGGALSISNLLYFGNGGAGGALTNYGTVVWGAIPPNYIQGYGGGVIYNAGSWQATANGSMLNQSGTNRFYNLGSLQKTGGTGTSSINWYCNSTGSCSASVGTLYLDQMFGNNTVPGAANFSIGTLAGTMNVLPGSVATIAGPTVYGSITVSSNAVMNWSSSASANLLNGSWLTVASGGTLAISNLLYFGNGAAGGALTNYGTVIWGGIPPNYIEGYGGTIIHNAGLWQATANGSMLLQSGTNVFSNIGTFQKLSSSGTSSIGFDWNSSGSTEVRSGSLSFGGLCVQSAGTTLLDGGSLSLSQPFQLLGGVLSGTNTINGTVTNSAVISPGASPGILTISGTYVQTPSGALNIELGGTNVGSQYDRLAISGTASLNGTLNISAISPFVPNTNDTFRVLTFNSFSGAFSSINGLAVSTNVILQATYLSSSLDLGAVGNTNHVASPPSIVSQPQSQTIVNGQTANLFVTVAGTVPFAYQWQHAGTNLPAATTSSLTLLNAQTNQSGNYLVIVTNSGGAVTSSVAILTVRPVADLVVQNISNPTNANAGEPFSVSWRSLNQGSQSALSPWTEAVALSTNSSGSPQIPVAGFVYHNDLAGGQFITRTQSVIAPGGLDGAYYVVVSTDTANQVPEDVNETNNTTISSIPITLHSPDLVPVALSSSPASAQFGASIPFSWLTTNAGSGPAQSSWSDKVYLNTISNSLSGASSLSSLSVTSVPFASGAVISNSATLTLPLTSASTNGTYYLIVSADDDNTIAESRETNNLASRPITLSLPPLPDLAVVNVQAPTQALSGVAFTMIWTTTNAGTAGLSSAWTESVVASNATAILTLADFRFTNSLPVGSSISRTQDVVFPSSLPAGNYAVHIVADSLQELVEASDANNDSHATNDTTLPGQLTLMLPFGQVDENATAFQATITRNGSFAGDLAVTLSNSPAGKLGMTNLVIIPAGFVSADFPVQPLTDGIPTSDQLVSITAGATNYIADTSSILVRNVDQPTLIVSLNPSAVIEGSFATGTVSRAYNTTVDLTVTLASSAPSQVSMPISVLIPSNQLSATFVVQSIDDTLVQGNHTNTITASASGFSSGAASLGIIDNDFPSVTLTLAQSTVSENAGSAATMATVTRSPVSSTPLVLDLTSSDPNSAQVPATVVIPASAASYSFPVAAINNAIVDSNRVVNLRVFIRATGTTVDIAEGTGATLTVTDDDGPTLQISLPHDVAAEGLNPAMTATVTRNTGTNSSLLVNLSSSRADKATVPATVTIPAGATSAPFDVTTLTNALVDGNQTVVLTASASGYVSGTKNLVVSDSNLPDLVVSQLSAPTNAYTDTFFPVTYRLENQGLASSGTNLLTRFYLSTDAILGNDTLLGDATVAGPLNAGQFFDQLLQFRLPSQSGTYWVIAKTDPDDHVSELREDNNTTIAAVPIVVQSAYTATVQSSLSIGIIPTNVTLTGTATLRAGGPAQFAPVNIHVFLRGTDRIIQAITDASGHFSTVFHPLPNEAGSYIIGAAHPGDATAPAQASFTLLGLGAQPLSAPLLVTSGSSKTGLVSIVNLGDTELTSLNATVLSAPANLNVSLNLTTNRVQGQASISLGYTVSAIDASQPQGIVQIGVSSAEGATATHTLFVAVRPPHSQVAAVPASLQAAMAVGGQQRVQFAIINDGGAASGPITLSVPSVPWLGIASSNPIPSLAPGETNLVTLLLTPAADLTLGHYTGSIIAAGSDSFATVPFDFTAMSVAQGSLVISAVDEFTFYADGSPGVTNAQVTITDHESQLVITNGVTDSNGLFSVPQITEAYYDIDVTADGHSSYHGGILVRGGITNNLEAFLSRQLVTYTWTVVPTTIEDRTRITIDSTFETAVPAPVITLDPPLVDLADVTSDVSQISLTISNHGLIAAHDLVLYPPSPMDWRITPLVTNLGTLTADGSFTVPILIERLSTNRDDCAFSLQAAWSLPTGSTTNHYTGSMNFINAGNCPAFVGSDNANLDNGGGGGGEGGGIIGTNDFGDEIIPVWPYIPPPPSAPGGGISFPPQYPTPSDIIAKVKVRLNQDLVLTRNAFKATLELENQSSTLSLSNIQITINVTDGNGQPANDKFGIADPTLQAINSVNGDGILNSNATGTASWTIVPARTAAPESAVVYYVGGRLQYTENGTTVSIPLAGAPINVQPDPGLHVKYFHQRDVYADDPFTDPIEPSVPYVLGVMVENRGHGEANNVHIVSGSPQIIQNDSGLLIDFNIIGSKVDGQDQTPSLTANFGDIAPGQRGIGLWYFTSSLQGFFSDYSATFQHVDALGNTNLSLVDEVTIHELTHLVNAPGPFDDGKQDFLVNDIPDPDNLPDRVYLSDGTTNPVVAIAQAGTDGPAAPGHLVVHLTASTPSGFVYIQVPDPGAGQYQLVSIVRSDSTPLSLDQNVWLTDRTFVPGQRPIYGSKLHIFDYNSTGSYTLTYQTPPPPDTTAPTSSVASLPASSYQSINLTWSGADEVGGSGIAFYDIYASVDGAAFQPWLFHTTLTGSLYTGQLGHSYAFYSLATDNAGNRQSPPVEPDAQTFVSLTNSPPMILASTNVTIDENQTLSINLAATDSDPGQTLAYTLYGAPSGLSINSLGAITWATSESTGPSTNAFSVVASDNGIPSLSSTSLVTVVVREVNSAPILSAITNRTINEGFFLRITNHATDIDIPANTLTYSLGGFVPGGASINSTNGIFTWTPDNTQGPSTNLISIIVADNGTPSMSATQQFTVIVRDVLSDITLSLGSTNVVGGETNTIPVVLQSSFPLTNITLQLSLSSSLVTNLALRPANSELTLGSISPAGSNLYSVNLNLDPSQQNAATRSIANLDFLGSSNDHSAIVFLNPGQMLGYQTAGPIITNGAALGCRVIIVSPEPVLELGHSAPLSLTLYGKAGATYTLSTSTDLGSGQWLNPTNITLTNNSVVLPLPFTGPATFYRAQQQ